MGEAEKRGVRLLGRGEESREVSEESCSGQVVRDALGGHRKAYVPWKGLLRALPVVG